MAVVYILLATALIASLSLLIGNAVLRMLGVALRRSEAIFLGFVLGSGLLAAIVFGMASVGLTRKGAFYILAAVLLGAGLWRRGFVWPQERFDSIPRGWYVAFLTLYGIFGAICLSVAMAPEASLDGSSHYLAGRSPGGVEMLFRFAFAIGKHSAAAMVELLFYLALPWGILAYAQRIGNPRAGVLGAMLFFLSPIAARTGTIAVPDIAIACIAFALFMALERRLLVPSLLLLGFLGWTITPWLLREFAKPVLHLNGWYARIPLDLGVHGALLDGMLGPAFLLTPLALLALRDKYGRRLVGWGLVFATPCLGAMETRAVIVGLPFLALALAMVLVEWRIAAPATLAAHALMSWPAFMPLYTDERAWVLRRSEWAAALRIESQDSYLMRTLPGYHLARVLDTTLPAGDRIFTMHAFPTAYSREMVEGDPWDEVLLAALKPERRFHELRFPERTVTALRLTPVFDGQGRWGIYEIHLYRGESEVPRGATWRADAALALDGNAATRWSSRRTSAGRIQFTLDLDAPVSVDRVMLECSPDQARDVRVEGRSASGDWGEITATRSIEDFTVEGLRPAAISFLKQAGFRWLIVGTSEARYPDFFDHAAEWGLAAHSLEDGYAVFRIE